MTSTRWLWLVGLLLMMPGVCLAQPGSDFVPVTDAMLHDPAAGDWLTWRRTPDGWGYSPLDQIDRRNVGDLRLVWSRALSPGSQQATPLVYNGVMYMPNPEDVIQAIDAATGDLIWEHRRARPDDLMKFVPLSSANRNIALWDNLVIDTSGDGYAFALDAATGREVWETRILDYRELAAHQTSGPIIANGKVVSGRGCMPQSGPEACVVVGHDARTGRELWRTHLIPRPGEPGYETWGNVPYEDRRHVGAWMVPSYDPTLNLVYVGTSVTSPRAEVHAGRNGQEVSVPQLDTGH